jgi:Caspase domain
MNLVHDQRDALQTSPAVHALLVGIGAYSKSSSMELANVPDAANSAWAVADWLKENQLSVPLGTCRVLTSDSGSSSSATVNQFLELAGEWHDDACSNRDNIALFFFTGNGFQRSFSEDLMLFEDFGGVGPALRGAVSVDNLFRGMAPRPDASEIARTQLYFIDTSRVPPHSERLALSSPTMVFDEYGGGPDDRSAVIFYSTQPGQHAFVVPSYKISIFTTALLRCLDGEAATPLAENSQGRWGITINSLIEGLATTMETLTKSANLPHSQVPVVGGLVRDQVIRYLESAPAVAVTVRISNPASKSELLIEDAEGQVVYTGTAGREGVFNFSLPSGLYRIRASDVDGIGKTSTLTNLRSGSSEVNLVMPL